MRKRSHQGMIAHWLGEEVLEYRTANTDDARLDALYDLLGVVLAALSEYEQPEKSEALRVFSASQTARGRDPGYLFKQICRSSGHTDSKYAYQEAISMFERRMNSGRFTLRPESRYCECASRLLTRWNRHLTDCTATRRCCSCHRAVVSSKEQLLIIRFEDVVVTELILNLCNDCTRRTGIRGDWRFSTLVKLLFPQRKDQS